MTQVKINSEFKADVPESQSTTSDPTKESKHNLTKKNSFEDVLKKISELRKGKTFATEAEVSISKDLTLISENRDFESFEHESDLVKIDSDVDEKDIEKLEEELNQHSNIIENALNPELQSILLGPNTQIITGKELESNTVQLIAYARKVGLNEKAISILLKNEPKDENLIEQKKINLVKNSFDVNEMPTNPLIKKNIKSTNPLAHHSLNKQFLHQDPIVKNDLNMKLSFNKFENLNSSKKLEIESDETIEPENPKNFKMLMKIKDENFLEKLLVKKLEEEKNPTSNRVERLQSIELGAKANQFINSLLTFRSSEISQSSKLAEIDSTLLAYSSGVNVSKSESSTTGSNQGSNREQQNEHIQLKRQEQFQQMAQRLGETLAKRITEQISRGAWRVQIALKPASLGSIEISLNLRGREIEASFHASQAFTRELLSESLPKLKENLEKAGMNVADMNITGQNNNKNGDNSTNEKEMGKDIKISKVENDTEEDGNNKDSVLNLAQSGGLNILV